jgi:protein gp37
MTTPFSIAIRNQNWDALEKEQQDFLIAGGESGPNFRPMDKAWAVELRDMCKAAGTAFFFKQSASLRSGSDPFLDGKAYEEFPKFDKPKKVLV